MRAWLGGVYMMGRGRGGGGVPSVGGFLSDMSVYLFGCFFGIDLHLSAFLGKRYWEGDLDGLAFGGNNSYERSGKVGYWKHW